MYTGYKLPRSKLTAAAQLQFIGHSVSNRTAHLFQEPYHYEFHPA